MAMALPLAVLAVLAVLAGFVELPPTLGGRPLFSEFLRGALPPPAGGAGGSAGAEWALQLLAAGVSLAGVAIAYAITLRWPQIAASLARSPAGRLWGAGWGFDRLYDRLFVHPYEWLAQAGRGDVVDRFYEGIARLAERSYRALSRTQSGRVRWYAAGLAVGAVVVIAVAVFL